MNKHIEAKDLPPQVFNLKGWIKLIDEKQLQLVFNELLQKAGFKILDFSTHQFPLNGFTAYWLLAESHLALHTFAQSGWCYVELTSCNRSKAERFKTYAADLSYVIRWVSEITEYSCEPTETSHL
ncbi:spermidine synthase [Marinilabiliaceae bacterium JC017]|nr:spermidine synthase [Marinilabiliaceae bacterium JC017]